MKHLRSTAAVVVIAAFAAARPACADEVTLIAPGGIRAAIEKLIPEFERQSGHTLKALGIADQMQPKIKRAQGGAGAMTMLAKGEVEIGLTFLSEITDPGVETVGILPNEISTPTALVGFLSMHAKSPEAARALLR